MQASYVGPPQQRAAAVDQPLQFNQARATFHKHLAHPLGDHVIVRHQQHRAGEGQALQQPLGQGLVNEATVSVGGRSDINQTGLPFVFSKMLVKVGLGAFLRYRQQ
ncbi:hypothetical protein PFLmoz3_06024 [Pseudomonas fluorescens]|uniref:Uncharacterized protein n=1 Tax=Pseudomonas fluorescens TaxID=294 RepID=A0A120G5F5_PSEFL|nr:hypothetical protein PFLmoz3_06024 [Pseudomonas fluorescens]